MSIFRNLNFNTDENDFTENRIMLRLNAVAQFLAVHSIIIDFVTFIA
jgi:hypothetical protein